MTTPAPAALQKTPLKTWVVGVLIALVLLAASVAVSWFVGHYAAPRTEGSTRFAWEPAAVAGTAFATALLAAFTGALAFETSRDVRATVELAQQGRDERERRDRPIIVASLGGTTSDSAGLQIAVNLLNAGLGPAFDLRLELSVLMNSGEELSSGHGLSVLLVERSASVSFTFAHLHTSKRISLSGTCKDRLDNIHEIRGFS